MVEKKSNLEHEQPFGGAIPKDLAREFKALIAEAGWTHKRAVAAAVMVFLRGRRGAPTLEGSDATRWYHEVAKHYPTEPPELTDEQWVPKETPGTLKKARNRVGKEVAATPAEIPKSPALSRQPANPRQPQR